MRAIELKDGIATQDGDGRWTVITDTEAGGQASMTLCQAGSEIVTSVLERHPEVSVEGILGVYAHNLNLLLRMQVGIHQLLGERNEVGDEMQQCMTSAIHRLACLLKAMSLGDDRVTNGERKMLEALLKGVSLIDS